MAERHTLMVICTTTGNLRDRFVTRPRQTSMYYHYGRGVAMIPLPEIPPPNGAELWTGGRTPKKLFCQRMRSRLAASRPAASGPPPGICQCA